MDSPCDSLVFKYIYIFWYIDSTSEEDYFLRTRAWENTEYTDVDWGGLSSNRRSTSTYCVLLWSNLPWKIKKQIRLLDPVRSKSLKQWSHSHQIDVLHVSLSLVLHERTKHMEKDHTFSEKDTLRRHCHEIREVKWSVGRYIHQVFHGCSYKLLHS